MPYEVAQYKYKEVRMCTNGYMDSVLEDTMYLVYAQTSRRKLAEILAAVFITLLKYLNVSKQKQCLHQVPTSKGLFVFF